MSQKPEWLPYFGPLMAFAIVLAVSDYFPGWETLFLALRVMVPASIFLFFWSKGAYPELLDFRPGAAGVLFDIVIGLLVTAIWVAPYLIWPSLRPGDSAAFDPASSGSGLPLSLSLRFAGFVLVTPVVEELLVRSYLIRAVDVYPTERDFREIPVGTFAWRSFLVTLAWFTFTHASWEWPVAFLAGVIYNLWIYRRKHISSLILAHAVTNAALFFLVIWGTEQGAGDWWFFL